MILEIISECEAKKVSEIFEVKYVVLHYKVYFKMIASSFLSEN